MARYRRSGKEDVESAALSNYQLDLTPQARMHCIASPRASGREIITDFEVGGQHAYGRIARNFRL